MSLFSKIIARTCRRVFKPMGFSSRKSGSVRNPWFLCLLLHALEIIDPRKIVFYSTFQNKHRCVSERMAYKHDRRRRAWAREWLSSVIVDGSMIVDGALTRMAPFKTKALMRERGPKAGKMERDVGSKYTGVVKILKKRDGRKGSGRGGGKLWSKNGLQAWS